MADVKENVEEVREQLAELELNREEILEKAEQIEEDMKNGKYSIIPPLSDEEQKLLDEEIAKRAPPPEGVPSAVDFPLHDIVREMGLDEPAEGTDPEFYEELKKKDAKTVYKNMKSIPDAVARKYLPDLARRFVEFERRIKCVERTLWALPRENQSPEEDRFEILTELLDKSCQGLEIWEEHCERKIPIGHRCVLEGELIHLMTTKFDLIDRICGEFDKLKGKKLEIDDEREMLRYEIRHCDMLYTEIHEKFLKSYLEMEW
uniref:DHC_N1 domain-containing protein n=1 Tax=Caenorhabditis tropicalis TaxID=1561998 RepID=A0A1I7UUM6_9PELO